MKKIPLFQRKNIYFKNKLLLSKKNLVLQIISYIYEEFHISYKEHPLPRMKIYLTTKNVTSSTPEESSIYISQNLFVPHDKYGYSYSKMNLDYKFIRSFTHEALHVIANNNLTGILSGLDEILTSTYEMYIFKKFFYSTYSNGQKSLAQLDKYYKITQANSYMEYILNENPLMRGYPSINKYGILLTKIFKDEMRTLYLTSNSYLLNDSNFMDFASSINDFTKYLSKEHDGYDFELLNKINTNFLKFLSQQYISKKIDIELIHAILEQEPIILSQAYSLPTKLPKKIILLDANTFDDFIKHNP